MIERKEEVQRELLKATEARIDKKILEANRSIATMSEEFHLELDTELKKRARRDNDFQNQKENMMKSIKDFRIEIDSVMKKMLLTAEAINCLKELFKI